MLVLNVWRAESVHGERHRLSTDEGRRLRPRARREGKDADPPVRLVDRLPLVADLLSRYRKSLAPASR